MKSPTDIVELGKFTALQVDTILQALRMLEYSWEYSSNNRAVSEQEIYMVEAIKSQIERNLFK